MRGFLCCAYIDGATGPAGPIIIDFAYAANTGAAAIPVNGLVPLPNDQVKGKDITISPDNTKFTVKAGGVYQVGYILNTDKALTAGARLLVNGEPKEVSAVGGDSNIVPKPAFQRGPVAFNR